MAVAHAGVFVALVSGDGDLVLVELYSHDAASGSFRLNDANFFEDHLSVSHVSSKADAKVTIHDDAANSQVIVDFLFTADGSSVVLFSWVYSYSTGAEATVSVTSRTIPHNLKVMYLNRSTDGATLTLITMNTSSQLQLLTINQTGAITNLQSVTHDYLTAGSATIYSRAAANPLGWDYWLFGATSAMTLNS